MTPTVPFLSGRAAMPWHLPHSREPEWMDDPGIAEADHLGALAALSRINLLSRTAAHLAAAAVTLLPRGNRRPTRCPTVVDVACGGGDVTIDLARRLDRAIPGGVRVIGVDSSTRAVERARRAAAAGGVDVAFEVRDVVTGGCPPCDLVVSSLFLHHLDDAVAAGLLRGMAAAAERGVVVSDLLRSRLGLGLAVVGTTVLSSSRVARVDGPLSVRAARTLGEYRALADASGLTGATVRRVWPERALLVWRRPAEGSP